MRKWRIEDSEELYNIKGWGVNYFGINEKGHAYVSPRKDGVKVDLKEIVDELNSRDITASCIYSFPLISTTGLRKHPTVSTVPPKSMTTRLSISSSTLLR